MAKLGMRLAKLSRPRPRRGVARTRLFERLDALTSQGCVWICGPPGAGKTTLITSWLDDRHVKGVWYHMDAGDKDPSTFFYYLAQSAHALAPRRRPLPLLTAEYLGDVDGFSRRFFRDFLDRLPDGAVLVLDNCQDVGDSETMTKVLTELIREIPDNLAVFLVSRSQPPEAFSQHILTQRLSVLGWDELRFTLDECRMVPTHHGKVTNEFVARLHRQTDGWIAGYLLLIRHAGNDIRPVAVEPVVLHEGLFDYFAAAILDRANPDDRRLLMITSVFPTFSVENAKELTDHPEPEQYLEMLRRNHLFVNRTVTGEKRYRYHDLFREFLARRYRDGFSPEVRSDIALRAAAFLVGGGDRDGAFALYREARLWDCIRELILESATTLLAQGRTETLREWIDTLPESELDQHPWIRYWLGCARMQTDLSAGSEVLAQAHASFKIAGDSLGQAMACATILHACFYEYDDFSRMDPWIDRLLALVYGAVQFPDAGSRLHVWSALLVAFSYRQPRREALKECVQNVQQLLEEPVDVNQRVNAAGSLLVYCTLAADSERAEPLIRRTEALLTDPGLGALSQAYWWLFVGYYHHNAANREPCLAAFDRSDQIAAENGIAQTAFLSRSFRCYAFCAWGDTANAAMMLGTLKPLVNHARAVDTNQFHLVHASYGIAVRNGAEAARHALLALEAARLTGSPFFLVATRTIGVFCLTAAGLYSLAREWIEDCRADVSEGYLAVYRPFLLFGQAFCARGENLHAEQMQALQTALELAVSMNAACFLRWAQSYKTTLFDDALRGNIEPALVTRLIRRYRAAPPDAGSVGWPYPIEIDTLGNFEIRLDGLPVTFEHKSPKKPITLLKAIISRGGYGVGVEDLVDDLWADDDGDRAHEAFTVALFRLRRLLGNQDAIRLERNAVTINDQLVKVDVLALLRSPSPSATPWTPALIQSICKGLFLPQDRDAAWTRKLRERARSLHEQCVVASGGALEAQGAWGEAEALYLHALNVDESREAFHEGLMRCCLRMRRYGEGVSTYRRLEQVLPAKQAVSPACKALYDELLAMQYKSG